MLPTKLPTEDKRKHNGGFRKGAGRKKGKTLDIKLLEDKCETYFAGIGKTYNDATEFLNHEDSDPLTLADKYNFDNTVYKVTYGIKLGRKEETVPRSTKNDDIKNNVEPLLRQYIQTTYTDNKKKPNVSDLCKKAEEVSTQFPNPTNFKSWKYWIKNSILKKPGKEKIKKNNKEELQTVAVTKHPVTESPAVAAADTTKTTINKNYNDTEIEAAQLVLCLTNEKPSTSVEKNYNNEKKNNSEIKDVEDKDEDNNDKLKEKHDNSLELEIVHDDNSEIQQNLLDMVGEDKLALGDECDGSKFPTGTDIWVKHKSPNTDKEISYEAKVLENPDNCTSTKNKIYIKYSTSGKKTWVNVEDCFLMKNDGKRRREKIDYNDDATSSATTSAREETKENQVKRRRRARKRGVAKKRSATTDDDKTTTSRKKPKRSTKKRKKVQDCNDDSISTEPISFDGKFNNNI